jgi:hypothetical protein
MTVAEMDALIKEKKLQSPWSGILVLVLAMIVELFMQAGSYRRTVHSHEEISS